MAWKLLSYTTDDQHCREYILLRSRFSSTCKKNWWITQCVAESIMASSRGCHQSRWDTELPRNGCLKIVLWCFTSSLCRLRNKIRYVFLWLSMRSQIEMVMISPVLVYFTLLAGVLIERFICLSVTIAQDPHSHESPNLPSNLYYKVQRSRQKN